jgi:hypothetical protein
MEKLQQKFALDVSRLILFAFEKGLAVTFGEAYRTAEQAALDATKGTGIRSSLHCSRLAIDLNLFEADKLQTETEDYSVLGHYWENMGTDHCWGGRFTSRPDGNHFSISPDGGRTR